MNGRFDPTTNRHCSSDQVRENVKENSLDQAISAVRKKPFELNQRAFSFEQPPKV
jgi:hypothetical protein